MEPKRWKVFRDAVSLLIGAAMLLHEELTGKVHWELLVTALVLIGSPAAIALVNLFVPRGGSDATPPSSQHPQ